MGLKPQVGCPFCEYISLCPLPTDGSNARDHDSAPSAPSAGCGRLAVVPVEEEQGEGAHHQEEEHPHAEASVVLDGLGGGARGVRLERLSSASCVCTCSPCGALTVWTAQPYAYLAQTP